MFASSQVPPVGINSITINIITTIIITGAPCWQGRWGRPLHTLPRSWGRANQLGFYDPEEKMLETALFDDEVHKADDCCET